MRKAREKEVDGMIPRQSGHISGIFRKHGSPYGQEDNPEANRRATGGQR
ncbi:hypothetical protein ABE236_19320 [Priestia endophytica]